MSITPTRYIDLDWEQSFEPLYGSPIIIPNHTLLWRGYDIQYEPISNRFAYFSSKNIATGYARQPNHTLGCFVTTKELKILDICFMKQLLRRIIQTNQTDSDIEDFVSTILSFGICSLGHQIDLLKLRFKDQINKKNKNSIESINEVIKYYDSTKIIEQDGFRIADTNNDAITMAFLQGLFEGHFDGFISPRLHTPFHVEKGGQLSPELIIFNPKQAHLQQLFSKPSPIIIMSFDNLLSTRYNLITINQNIKGKNIYSQFYMSGGHLPIYNDSKHYLDDFETKVNKKNKSSLKKYIHANQAGQKWNRKFIFTDLYAPVPSFTITPFPSSLNQPSIEERMNFV